MNYGFIGLGNMASAIIRGMAANKAFSGDRILGFNRSPEKTKILVDTCNLIPCGSAADVVEKSDVVVLSVKPQVLPDIIETVAAGIRGKLVLTIAAGKTLEWYAGYLPEKTPVIRIMPNINATVGASVTAICGNSNVAASELEIARRMFQSVGTVYEISETQFSAFSAICGASGAFIHLYIDALAEAGVREGFPRPLAEAFATDTVLGSAKLQRESGEHPIALMNKVCSPGGTTVEGVMKLKQLGFESAVQQGIAAIVAKDRAMR